MLTVLRERDRAPAKLLGAASDKLLELSRVILNRGAATGRDRTTDGNSDAVEKVVAAACALAFLSTAAKLRVVVRSFAGLSSPLRMTSGYTTKYFAPG